jgi:hypothetical protein
MKEKHLPLNLDNRFGYSGGVRGGVEGETSLLSQGEDNAVHIILIAKKSRYGG